MRAKQVAELSAARYEYLRAISRTAQDLQDLGFRKEADQRRLIFEHESFEGLTMLQRLAETGDYTPLHGVAQTPAAVRRRRDEVIEKHEAFLERTGIEFTRKDGRLSLENIPSLTACDELAWLAIYNAERLWRRGFLSERRLNLLRHAHRNRQAEARAHGEADARHRCLALYATVRELADNAPAENAQVEAEPAPAAV